ncbi:signal peptidase I [Noviherbaspirillum cavernae]|uniref:Signal peptidase I n=1 Tax=Noviherbaspirillum cavernae TaxID=2320862 RepID=A0A418WZA4_9BURK|nr:signal peptidase I [Noviherbaspirillum cavernae]RJG05567.1 signal peptidase I [Noviherbaspirillum cavernae]
MRAIRELIAEHKWFIALVLCMIMLRSAIADWYGVPSGSMYPTVLIGDRVLSNRLAYDLKIPFTDVIVKRIADPQRGDIVTFTSPEDGIRLVKRVVAVPGDVVEMRDDELLVNGVQATYTVAEETVAARLVPDYRDPQVTLNERIFGHQRTILLMPQRKALRSFRAVTVPAGAYLVLGDNRNNSKDSRYIGFIKRELLTGQVERVILSLDAENYYLPRMERFGVALN